MALALEDPDPDLTGATGVNQVPDMVARVRWEPRQGGHVQVSGLFRQLRGEPAGTTDVAAAGGYGTSVSGRLPFALWSKRDQVLFQVNGGTGIGRYISDLRSLGGQDGVFDPVANELQPLVVYSGLVGYEHWWSDRLRSSLSVAKSARRSGSEVTSSRQICPNFDATLQIRFGNKERTRNSCNAVRVTVFCVRRPVIPTAPAPFVQP